MLRWLTAGESHGPALVAILEGLPAGRRRSRRDDVADALARRRLGYGRGARMKFEQDEVEFLGGVRHGLTLGAPVAIRIGNTEWPKWETVMCRRPGRRRRARRGRRRERREEIARNGPLTRPRPGPRRPGRHAEVRLRRGPPGPRARLGPRDRGPGRARRGGVAASSSRPSASGSSRTPWSIGGASVPDDAPLPDRRRRRRALDADPVRCLDADGRRAMVAEIEPAHKDGDTLGGVVEVVVYGLPPGLGSHVHWDRRLDARLAGALMGIQAIKGVEVGDGFAHRRAAAARVAHDEIERDRRRRHPPPHRPRRRHRGRHVHRRGAAGARGDEADRHRARGRCAPSTSPPASRPSRHPPALRRVRRAGRRRRRRGDGRAGAGRRRAGEVRRRLGRRDRAATSRRYLAAIPASMRTWERLMAARRARRPARVAARPRSGRRWPSCWGCRCATPTPTSRRPRAARSPTSSSRTARRPSAPSSAAAVAAALAEHDGRARARRGSACSTRRPRELLAGQHGRLPRRRPRRRGQAGRPRPAPAAAARQPARPGSRRCSNERTPVYESVADPPGRHRRAHARGRRGRGRGACWGTAVSDPPAAATAPPSAGGDAVRRRRRARPARPGLPALLGDGVAAGRSCVHPRALARPGRSRCVDAAARARLRRATPPTCPTARRPRPPTVAAGAVEALGQAGFTRSDAVVGRRRRRVTDLGGFVAATWLRGVARRARADHPARHGRRRRRRQDRHQHRRGQEPRRRLPRAGRGALRPRRCWRRCRAADLVAGLAEVVKCGFIADPAILDLVEADPAGADPLGRARAARAGRAGDRGQGRRRRRRTSRETGAARDPQLRAHPRRTRSSRSSGYAVPARRGGRDRHGRTSPSSARARRPPRRRRRRRGTARCSSSRRAADVLPGGPFDDLLAAMRRDKKSRGALLRFVVLDGSAAPVRLEGPGRGLAARRLRGHRHADRPAVRRTRRPRPRRAHAARHATGSIDDGMTGRLTSTPPPTVHPDHDRGLEFDVRTLRGRAGRRWGCSAWAGSAPPWPAAPTARPSAGARPPWPPTSGHRVSVERARRARHPAPARRRQPGARRDRRPVPRRRQQRRRTCSTTPGIVRRRPALVDSAPRRRPRPGCR